MALVSAAAPSGGVSAVTGSGFTGSEVTVVSTFASTDGKRRYVESYRAPVVAGAVDYNVRVPFASGTVIVKALDPSTAAVLATATTLNV